MTNVNQNIFKEFWTISTQVQSIQKKVEGHPISFEQRKMIHTHLETLQSSLESLRQQACATHKQFEEMEHQIVSLYGQVEEQFENYEISHISKQALELCHSAEAGQLTQLAKKMDTLMHHIHFLFKHRRPSLQHRKIVHIILKLTEHAKNILSSKAPLSQAQVRTLYLLKMLLREAILQAEKAIDPTEAELMMELYEVIALLNQKKTNEALLKLKWLYPLLTAEQKKKIESTKENPQTLLTALLDLTGPDDQLLTQLVPYPPLGAS